MRFPRLALLLGLTVAFALALGVGPKDAHAASPDDQLSASQSYYTLDVEAGAANVRVEITVQPAGERLDEVWLWAMPVAEDIVVTLDGEPLETEVPADGSESGSPTVVLATLPEPLLGKNRLDLEMTYTAPPQESAGVFMEPGIMELSFVSQGAGSFVFFDLPVEADNYIDPGCLRTTDQPPALAKRGYERWVCGETVLLALGADKPELLNKCASLDDSCRQRLFPNPLSGFVQSITDEAKRGVLEAEVQLKEFKVTLTLKYFLSDAEWASRQFEIAQQALPLLEDTFGWAYPRDTLLIRESRHIALIGAAGIAFPTEGEVLLSNWTGGVDEEVTIHELAHQWAGFNLTDPWLWEGLAEYGTRVVAPALAVEPRDWGWELSGYTDPLATWWRSSEVFDATYWYGRSAAFWFAYADAVGGPAAMGLVLASMNDDSERLPLDGRWFLDAGERVSGANLDELFLDWVWVTVTTRPILEERRAAHDAVTPLRTRAAELGFAALPREIRADLDLWIFGGVAGDVAEANALLDAYLAMQVLADAAGLPRSEAVHAAWADDTLAATRTVIAIQRNAINAIVASASTLSDEPGGSPAIALLDEARARYAAGDLQEASRLASEAVTGVINRAAAAAMIALAERTEAEFTSNVLRKVGLLLEDPNGYLAAAQAAFAEGDSISALGAASRAVEAWDGAQNRGLQRLALAAAILCGLSFAGWWLLQRGGGAKPDGPRGGDARHSLGQKKESGGWRNWENS